MNTGIQDALNLGWKLATVLNGADPAVLDTPTGNATRSARWCCAAAAPRSG